MNRVILKNIIHLHLIVLIYGFTAILGKLVTLPSPQLVWYRMLIAALGLAIFLKVRGNLKRVKKRDLWSFLGIGLIVAAHWITFFGAVKIANVSVTLGCMAATTLFTSLMEPVLVRRPFRWLEVALGLVIIAGLYLIFQFETKYHLGILVALTSAFLAGLFTILNKKYAHKYPSTVISFYEMIGGVVGISLYLLFSGQWNPEVMTPKLLDWLYIAILGLICTAYAFAASVAIMRHLSAYMVVLTINMEPVYGILMAWMIFGQSEQMTPGFYFGTLTILAAVFSYPLLTKESDHS